MSTHSHEPCAAADLEIGVLSDHEWRVSDRRLDEQSPEKVLGYINHSGSTFEVLYIEAPRRHMIFDQLEPAIASFATTTRPSER